MPTSDLDPSDDRSVDADASDARPVSCDGCGTTDQPLEQLIGGRRPVHSCPLCFELARDAINSGAL